MNRKIMKTNSALRQGIILSIIFLSIISSITVASAVDRTYYWDRTNGVSIAGFTTNWTSCSSSSPQNGYRVTSLGSSASSCTNGALTRSNAGDLFLAIFPTAYSSDTQITGMANARFYLRSNSGSATYRFDLGYARTGTFTSLGYVTRTGVSTSGTTYTIDLSTISGIAPAGSDLALKVSVTTSGGGRVYMGTNGGTSGSNSGRFYVSETAAPPSTPTYNVTITASPASADTTAGSSYVYNIAVNNIGNTNGNYTLSVADSDTANFIGSTLGTTAMQISSGSNAATTLTVTAKAGATIGAMDSTTVTVRSVENSVYTNSTNVQTTVISTPNPGAINKTYYWDRTTGVSIAGYTTNWSSCSSSSPQNGYRVTSLGSSASSCTNGALTRSNAGDLFLAIFPTAYSSDTQITGMANARFYLRSNSGSATYRFDLGYARTGTFTSLGYVTRTGVSTSGTTYTIDLSTISGIAPAGSDLALKVSVTTSGGGRVYMGTNGGTSGSNSGRFYVSETAAPPSTPRYNVTIIASPASADTTAGSSYVYNIIVSNTGNTKGNYTLSAADSDTVNFTGSTLGTTAMQINSGSNATTTLTVTAKTSAITGARDNTTVTVRSVENSTYTNSTNVRTTVITAPVPGTDPKIIVKANRYVVLDDPNAGTTAPGFFSPADVRGGNWGTNYWSGESTTIRAAAIVMSSSGSKLPGVTITFKLINPAGGSPVHTATSITDGEGAAYYSYDLNSKNYWGNWKIDASATVSGSNIANSSSFVLYWWGCGQCHGSESPGNWGTRYTPKSYYTMGYDFHRSQNKAKHTETMAKGNCITCHQMYNGIPTDRGYTDNTPAIYVENEYSPDWHNGKVACQGCHAGSNISANPQGKNPEIAGCYDTPGCHPKKNTNVNRENSTSGYVVGGNYKSLYSNIPNSAKAHTVTSVRCILCHDAGHDISKPYNVSGTSNANTENEQCWTCHTQRPAHYGTSCTGCHSQDAHNISVSGGGPDCISCHGLGGTAVRKVDENAIAAGVHGNLNSGATASGVSAANKKCWGCHQSDGNQPTDMGNKYNTPYRCYECHGPTKPYARVNGALTINEHFKSALDVKAGIFAIDNSSSCALCHSVPEMRVSFTDNDFTELSIGSHYGKNRSGTLDCQYCHQNASTAFSAAMMSNIQNNNLTDHSRSPATPVCTTCHGSGMLHDATLTKPASSNGTYCKTCHSNKNDHKTVYCAECHTNNTDRSKAGREIHDIRYLQKDNTFSTEKTNAVDCTICHQSDVVNSSLILAPIQISDPLHHSDDINNGSIWGNYWTNPISACLYCHNDTRHSATPLGRPLMWNPSYVLNTTIGSGTNCADCHYKADSNYGTMTSAYAILEKPPEITSGSWNGKPGYYNHTLADYTDSQCKSCHDKAGSTTVGQMMHNASTGSAGGPDCKSCHDIGGSAPAHVNFSVSTGIDALHSGLNRDATSTVDATNKKCWACHGDGTQPISGHPSNYRTPYTCENCHVQLQGGYTPSTIMEVKNHYWNGTNISTSSISSCQLCHNRTEMMLAVYDPEMPDNPSHYGKKRSDLGAISDTNSYCTYCHNSTGNGATFYVSAYNNSIVNHSGSIVTPLCNNCHNTGRLHDTGIAKPVSSDALCKNCHADRSEHKTLYCTECHANNTDGSKAGRDIHGIKFLQNDNTFSQSKTDAVDCKTCHQSIAVDSSLGTFTAEKIGVLHHSDNITNGSIWGNYWTNSLEACLYCHNDTRHSATPLGRPLLWNPSYQMRTTIGTGTNCADCHYQGDPDYTGMSSVLAGAGLPPEITSGSWNGKPGYYNHTLSDYTDSQCSGCHYRGTGTTVGQMLHDASEGTSGGPDCKACHDAGGSAPKLINFSVANTSAHMNLNSGASSTVNAENKKCWACHGDGTQPGSGHPVNYKTPSSCENCHTGTGGYSAPLVKEHVQNGNDVQTAANCNLCHDNNGMYLDGGGLGTVTHYLKDVTDTATTPYGHLGPIDTSNCLICHNGVYTGDPVWGSPVNITTSPKRAHTETSNAQCDGCHKDGTIQTLANVDFHYLALTAGAGGDNCLGCHAGSQ